MPPGNGVIDALHLVDRLDGASAGASTADASRRARADCRRRPPSWSGRSSSSHDELAVHHRHAPEAPPADQLRSASRRRRSGARRRASALLGLRARRSRRSPGSSARIGRRGCATACELVAVHSEQQHGARPAGHPASRRAPACARCRPRRRRRSPRWRSRSSSRPPAWPIRAVGRDDEPRAAHAESFGKGVVDLDAFDDAGRAFLGRVLDAVCNAHQVRAAVGCTTMLPLSPSTISSSDRLKFSIRTVR